MSSSEHNTYEPYVLAAKEQLSRHIVALDELVAHIGKRELTFNEQSACERHIQVIVEMAIGVSKHYLKKRGRPVPVEARVAISDAYLLAGLKDPALAGLRGAVGMRNVIVHDYLNVSWSEIETVLSARAYLDVERYVGQMSMLLLS